MSALLCSSRLLGPAAGLLLLTTLLLTGCEGRPTLTAPAAPVLPAEGPYETLADRQYRALRFIDRDLQSRAGIRGKRLSREALAPLLAAAHERWLLEEGYPPDRAARIATQLPAHLSAGPAAVSSTTLAVMLTARGFREAQRRHIEALIDAAETAASFHELRGRMRRAAAAAARQLGEDQSGVVQHLAARLEGIGRFLDEQTPEAFPPAAPAEITRPGTGAGKAAYDPACARGPKPWYQHFKWRNLVKQMISGGMTGCTIGGGLLVWTGAGAGIGCGIGSAGGSSLWAYYYWQDVSDAEEKALRSWCDKCFFAAESPRNDLGKCRRRFGTELYPTGYPPIPPDHQQQ